MIPPYDYVQGTSTEKRLISFYQALVYHVIPLIRDRDAIRIKVACSKTSSIFLTVFNLTRAVTFSFFLLLLYMNHFILPSLVILEPSNSDIKASNGN